MAEPETSSIMPSFIVPNVSTALAFYRDRLGFDIEYQGPADDDIFFGIVGRGEKHDFYHRLVDFSHVGRPTP
jgi:catechol 2,3-dioxygenase-like lactoylglutathione lyase family enzyme